MSGDKVVRHLVPALLFCSLNDIIAFICSIYNTFARILENFVVAGPGHRCAPPGDGRLPFPTGATSGFSGFTRKISERTQKGGHREVMRQPPKKTLFKRWDSKGTRPFGGAWGGAPNQSPSETPKQIFRGQDVPGCGKAKAAQHFSLRRLCFYCYFPFILSLIRSKKVRRFSYCLSVISSSKLRRASFCLVVRFLGTSSTARTYCSPRPLPLT